MKGYWILSTLFLFSCAASRSTVESTPQSAPKPVSDEEIINSLLATEVSTDPMAAPEERKTSHAESDQMVFEDAR